VQAMLDAEVTGDPVAYVTHIGGLGAEHGQEYLQETKNVFGESNVIDAGAHAFSIDVTAAQTIIGDAKTALGDPGSPDYDIFCAFTYPTNVDALTQAAIDLDFNPPAMLFGPGANFGYYPYNFADTAQNITTPPGDGRLVDGICTFAVATPETTVAVGTTPTMSMADLFDDLAAQLDADVASGACLIPLPGALLLDYWGIPCYAAALEMWQYAVEDVGELDSVAIRNILASYDSGDPADTVFGDTWFAVFPEAGGNSTARTGGGVMDYMCHTGEIGQWQLFEAGNTSIMEVVGYTDITDDLPNYCVTGDFQFPMTDEWYWIKND